MIVTAIVVIQKKRKKLQTKVAGAQEWGHHIHTFTVATKTTTVAVAKQTKTTTTTLN